MKLIRVNDLPAQTESGEPVEYRDVVGFPAYKVGDDGSIWSSKRGGWHRVYARARGGRDKRRGGRLVPYVQVKLRRDLRKHWRYVHLLVLEAFVGPRPPGLEACHGNDDPSDNRRVNLRWDTHKANHADQARLGTQRRGERIGWAKLTDADVIEARRLKHEGLSFAAIARRLSVNLASITNAIVGRSWKHLNAVAAAWRGTASAE